jgi:hypothetical protein
MGINIYVRGNMDSIAICILRCAICILQKILGKWTLLLNPSDLEEKNPYCIYIHIAVQYGFFLLITAKNRLIGHARSNTHQLSIMILDHYINIKPLRLLLSIIADMWRRREERRRLNQLDERPERGVTRGDDGAMRGGGAGR